MHSRKRKGIGGGILALNTDLPKVGVTFYVEVKGPEAMLKSITKAGGKVITPVTKIPKIG